MRIAHIQPSVITVPPNGWGAIEKIIWDYKIVLESLGHSVSIVNLYDIQPNQYDIVHCHMFDQALHLANINVPYFYSHHDHHSMVWGIYSQNYLLNLEAMQKAEVAFVHAESSVELFQNVPYYLSHGVNIDFFNFKRPKPHEGLKLLIVGNNGLAGREKVFDRKGFRYAIEAARLLDLEITLVGPESTQTQFFTENPDLVYEKLNLVYNATEEELRHQYHSHDIMIHATYVEAGHPPLTPLEALSCGVPVIGTPMGKDVPQVVCERDTASVIEALVKVIPEIKKYSLEAREIALNYDWKNIVENNLLSWYFKVQDKKSMGNVARRIYHQTKVKNQDDNILFNYIEGAKIDVVGHSDKIYNAQIWDSQTNQFVYQADLKCGMFAQSAKKYHRSWIWKITEPDGKIHTHAYNANGKRVYIAFESSSLGDTLAWVPMVEEFRKKHECQVVCSTFWNHLVAEAYPEIQFIKAGDIVNNIYAMYRLGWFYDENSEINYNHHSRNFREFSLQETACDILGLDDVEIRPKIKNVPSYFEKNQINKDSKKYVVIAPHASASAKYWHNEDGWQKVVEYLNNIGYEVWNISKESANDDWHNSKLSKNALLNVIDMSGDAPIEERISQIKSASLFIGLGSGLSWLAWSCETPVVLISGFSRPVSEFKECTRVFNQNVCNGCFNDFRLDAGNWNWCPKYENSENMYECSKSITAEQVIDAIRKTIK